MKPYSVCSSSLVAVAVSSACLLMPFAASADAIDGNWCFGVKRLSINGPEIVTPGGTRMYGDYGRHDFRYVVPAGEAGAGNTVEMDLLGEDDMQLWPNGRMPDSATGGAQMWKRCAAPVS
ncbi:MAG: hypothetical protein ACPGRZ_09865 [Alphaproteobacteria bacterium]